ncbi:hypothetical protein FRC10_002061 [Ceratobasidium sp. 414]|nr:hypothetical protein FRC10_002061 [Ceratobasidium sp. 414]
MFKVKNQEFTFDVDVSNLPCGLNEACTSGTCRRMADCQRILVTKLVRSMGLGTATLGPEGYQANVLGWTLSSNDVNSGTSQYGTCCNEMDVWEADSIDTAYTLVHPGCDFNSFRMGNQTFFGEGMTVDSSQNVSSSPHHHWYALRDPPPRCPEQQSHPEPLDKHRGNAPYDSITEAFCSPEDRFRRYQHKGGLAQMSKAFDQGMVLVMSVWDDHAANMLWLDSDYPMTASGSSPGVHRGSCATTSGVPADVEVSAASAPVAYLNIRFGDVGSTYTGTTTGTTTTQPCYFDDQDLFGCCGKHPMDLAVVF